MTPEPTFSTLQLNAFVDRLRAGDPASANYLLRQVCSRLERLARRMLKGFPNVKRWVDTDDVLQNALVRLLRTLQAVRPESTRDFFNLAAVHIRRELLDLARHYRNRLDVASGSESAAGAAVEVPDQRDVAADLDQWSAFHTVVEQLPGEEREVVALMFYHGWTQAEIGELLGVDARTVRRRCARRV